MLGVSDKDWIIELLSDSGEALLPGGDTDLYSVYFGFGHHVRLRDQPGVFKVSLAGQALGAQLLRNVSSYELTGRSLDMGTGSGALALLLRSMGACDVTATDLSSQAIALARQNELLNFPEPCIAFSESNLFREIPHETRFDVIAFNPPGWRSPSNRLLAGLEKAACDEEIGLDAMFYGDEVLLEFLLHLPQRLHPRGRAIVGLNSMVGIREVLDRYRAVCDGVPPLRFRLLERHSLPFLFYTPAWKRAEQVLREEFHVWRERYGAAYTTDSRGRMYWSYEVVECRLVP